MCKYGTYMLVKVNYRNLTRCIDACIADEIQWLNNQGVITLGCCCGHGESDYNPCCLVSKKSIKQCYDLRYLPIGYEDDIYKIELKSGCRTLNDVEKWHQKHKNKKFFDGFGEGVVKPPLF